MILNKNIKTFVILLVAILFLYLIYNVATSSNQQNVQNIPAVAVTNTNINEKVEINPIKTGFKIQENKPNSALTALQNNNDIPKDLPPFLKTIEQRKNSGMLLQVDDLPPELQASMKEWLLSYQKKGYIDSSDVALDHMELQNSQAGFLELNDPSIAVSLQNIEKTKLSTYEYKGAIFDKTKGAENLTVLGVKRLYVDSNGNEVSLYEKSLVKSFPIAIKEFVSDDIRGYPGVRMTLCTESKRCTSKITFMTKDKLYEIMVKGDKESTKEQLIELALSLDLPDIQK